MKIRKKLILSFLMAIVLQDEERVYLLTSEGKEVAKLLRYLDRAAGMRKGA